MILLHVIRHRDIVATMLRQWDTLYRAPCFFHCGDLSLCVYMYLMHHLGQQSNYTGSEHTDLLLRAPVYCPPDSQGHVFTQLPLTNSQVSLGVALFYPLAPPLPSLRPLFSLQQVSPSWFVISSPSPQSKAGTGMFSFLACKFHLHSTSTLKTPRPPPFIHSLTQKTYPQFPLSTILPTFYYSIQVVLNYLTLQSLPSPLPLQPPPPTVQHERMLTKLIPNGPFIAWFMTMGWTITYRCM